jgi:hypothetical protein
MTPRRHQTTARPTFFTANRKPTASWIRRREGRSRVVTAVGVKSCGFHGIRAAMKKWALGRRPALVDCQRQEGRLMWWVPVFAPTAAR